MDKKLRWTRRRFIKAGLLTAIGGLLLDAFWFERYVLKWNSYQLDDSNEANPLKIIQLSDLHLKKKQGLHESLARRINKEMPDLLVLTGDVIESNAGLALLDDVLGLIDRAIPKLAITGNWEYWGGVDLAALNALYQKHNGQLLRNEHQIIELKGRKLAVIGIDDWLGSQANYQQAIAGMQATDFTLVLTHCPQHRNEIIAERGAENIDLVLCGHTHGGQIAFFGYAPMRPAGSDRYVSGWYQDNNLPTYVSRGVGTSVLPVRFGARAEMVIFQV